MSPAVGAAPPPASATHRPPGTVGPPGVPSVLIGGRPAATVGTAHLCSSPAGHPPSAIAPPGSSTVLIGGQPAARVGDLAACGSPVVSGCATVLIGR
ncbi:PaaR repeat-containing protein [Streptomyces sp. S6]|nr:PaaR repeat-containing protein [Streptomyces sp. S6]